MASRSERRARRGSLLVIALLWCAGCATDVSGSGPAPLGDVPLPAPTTSATLSVPSTTGPRMGPLTPRDPDRITAADREAIEAIGASTAGEPPDGHGHDHTIEPFEAPLLTGDKAAFAHQWLQARASTSRFDTLDEVRALGYVRSSAPVGGIGAHWVLWPQIAEPFDPAWPAMVLFDESVDPARLVGYSYWVQSPTEPVGFAGGNDHWHQHQGLCVVNGWVDRERSAGPDACAGTYFPGGDLWMLHAWPVPDYENRAGNFAVFNRKLCPAAARVPDVMRCPA